MDGEETIECQFQSVISINRRLGFIERNQGTFNFTLAFNNLTFNNFTGLMNLITFFILILGDSRNYMPPILVPSSAKRTATKIVTIAKLNRRKDFVLRGFVCDIICPSKELTV